MVLGHTGAVMSVLSLGAGWAKKSLAVLFLGIRTHLQEALTVLQPGAR